MITASTKYAPTATIRPVKQVTPETLTELYNGLIAKRARLNSHAWAGLDIALDAIADMFFVVTPKEHKKL